MTLLNYLILILHFAQRNFHSKCKESFLGVKLLKYGKVFFEIEIKSSYHL